MRCEWDENNNRLNLAKHGISFEYAIRVCDDPDHAILIDDGLHEEERWLAIGNIGYAAVVVAVHTDRGDANNLTVRIISAERRQDMSEPDTKKRRSDDDVKTVLRHIASIPDEDIDTSDIPEITEAQWVTAQMGRHFRPNKTSITIRLDADLLDWFRSRREGGYQTEINRVLRNHKMESFKNTD